MQIWYKSIKLFTWVWVQSVLLIGCMNRNLGTVRGLMSIESGWRVRWSWDFPKRKWKQTSRWDAAAKPPAVRREGRPLGVEGPETTAPLCPQAPGQVHPPAGPPLWSPLHNLCLLPGGCHGDAAVLWIGPWLIPGKLQTVTLRWEEVFSLSWEKNGEAESQIFPEAEGCLVWQRPKRRRGRTSLCCVTLSGTQVPHQSREGGRCK